MREELSKLLPRNSKKYRQDLEGKKVAVYVGGAFKAFSLIKAFRHLGMEVVLVGSQTGTKEDYEGTGRHLRSGHGHRGRLQPSGTLEVRQGT